MLVQPPSEQGGTHERIRLPIPAVKHISGPVHGAGFGDDRMGLLHDHVRMLRVSGEDYMNQCKHRWEPTNFGIKYRTPGSYWYVCAQCGKTIFAQLKDKS